MKSFDVVIMGGGLAGLTSALHLRKELPALSIAVIEPSARPLPDACFKVGESSVEIGAHFFSEVLGLKSYLEERQLVKFGLRYFVGDGHLPVSERRELGPSEQPVVPSYQLDRGRFETDLRGMVQDAGITLMEGASVFQIELGEGDAHHQIQVARKETIKETIEARWLIDASGRRRLLQSKLGLGVDPHHHHSSSWFRVAKRVNVADLVPETEHRWHGRDLDGRRWLSTSHFCGKGYWVWVIPLSTGYQSIGIVAGEEHHPFATFGRPETAKAFLEAHEPVLAAHLAGLVWEDFAALRRYAYGSKQVFSAEQRWSCIGEAGIFLDPLYSPGSDFIGIGCSMTTELLRADLASEESDASQAARSREFNEFFLAFAEVTATTFRGHSHIMGSPTVLPAKLYWDNFHYWSFVCPYFFNRIFAVDPEQHARFRATHRRFHELNQKAQKILKAWAELSPGHAKADFVAFPLFPSLLADLHIDLTNRRSPQDTLAMMEKNLAGAQEVVVELVCRALKAVGPEQIERFVELTDLRSFRIGFDLDRIEYDVAQDRAGLRKGLSKVVRDMDRCLPKQEMGGAPLRGLIEQALGRPLMLAESA